MLLADSLLDERVELVSSFVDLDHFLLQALVHALLQKIHHGLRLHQHLLLHELHTLGIVIEVIIVYIRLILDSPILFTR